MKEEEKSSKIAGSKPRADSSIVNWVDSEIPDKESHIEDSDDLHDKGEKKSKELEKE